MDSAIHILNKWSIEYLGICCSLKALQTKYQDQGETKISILSITSLHLVKASFLLIYFLSQHLNLENFGVLDVICGKETSLQSMVLLKKNGHH